MKHYVLATSRIQFLYFCREFDLVPNKDVKYLHEDYHSLLGLSIGGDNLLFLLEGFQHNPNYTVEMCRFLNFFSQVKFDPIFISEAEIYHSA